MLYVCYHLKVRHVTDDDMVHNYLVPCVVEFAAATTADTQWKALNHQLLLYSKDDDSKVWLLWLHYTKDYKWNYHLLYSLLSPVLSFCCLAILKFEPITIHH